MNCVIVIRASDEEEMRKVKEYISKNGLLHTEKGCEIEIVFRRADLPSIIKSITYAEQFSEHSIVCTSEKSQL